MKTINKQKISAKNAYPLLFGGAWFCANGQPQFFQPLDWADIRDFNSFRAYAERRAAAVFQFCPRTNEILGVYSDPEQLADGAHSFEIEGLTLSFLCDMYFQITQPGAD
jgi:hypothetical protein